MRMKDLLRRAAPAALCLLMVLALLPVRAGASDLDRVRESGVLRHLGIPYANFVTGHGYGLSVEIMQLFAKYLGVEYRFVQSNWGDLFGDLTGRKIKPVGDNVEFLGKTEIRGDVIANGLTKLAWREKVVNYSTPTFPTQVWCIVRADFPAMPIVSTGDVDRDIAAVKELLRGRRVMGKDGTCLAPGLYGIESLVAEAFSFPGTLNDIAPALIKGEAEVALLDVPDSLVALEKWPGKIKVLGPLSPEQEMAAGFRKDSPEMLKAFNEFFAELKRSGEYLRLVRKYYPAVFRYYRGFFDTNQSEQP
jgi:ABC-type amino acid transport substrate-binding protein